MGCSPERDVRLAKEISALRARIATLERSLARENEEKERIRRSEELHRKILESADDGIVLTDAHTGNIINANPTFERLAGRSLETLHTFRLSEITPDSTIRNPQSAIAECFPIQRPDGKVIWTELHTTGFTLHDTQYILNVCRDITKRKQVEEEFRRQYEILEKVTSSVQVGLAVIDRSYRLLWVNQTYREWFMLQNDFLTLHCYEACRSAGRLTNNVAAEDSLFTICPRCPARETFMTSKLAHTEHPDVTTSLGSNRTLTITTTPVCDSQGGVIQSIELIQDVTEQQAVAYRMFQSRRMEAISTLASSIADNFNNLLMGMLGYAALVRSDLGDEHVCGPLLKNLEKSAERAGDLAQELLACVGGGKEQVRLLNLNDAIRETLNNCREMSPSNIVVESSMESDLWSIRADRSQMQRAMMNLFMNSIEAMPAGGQLKLTTRNMELNDTSAAECNELKPGRYVCVTVEDTGCGMDEKTLSKIYRPFFSTKLAGRGLGLAAIRGIVKNHNGQITISSRPHEGTTCVIYLPAAEPVQEVTRQLGGHETVLVIDDDRSVCDVTKRMLECLGYRVLLSEVGEKAVEVAASAPGEIHAVLLDIGLPSMSSEVVLRRLQEIRPDIPIILCSSSTPDARAEALMNTGAVKFIQKPFRLDTIAGTVRAVLGS